MLRYSGKTSNPTSLFFSLMTWDGGTWPATDTPLSKHPTWTNLPSREPNSLNATLPLRSALPLDPQSWLVGRPTGTEFGVGFRRSIRFICGNQKLPLPRFSKRKDMQPAMWENGTWMVILIVRNTPSQTTMDSIIGWRRRTMQHPITRTPKILYVMERRSEH